MLIVFLTLDKYNCHLLLDFAFHLEKNKKYIKPIDKFVQNTLYGHYFKTPISESQPTTVLNGILVMFTHFTNSRYVYIKT